MKIIVLGGGLVGGPMAIDLAKDSNYEVTLADINRDSLQRVSQNHPIKILEKDLSDPETVTALVSDYDFAVNAVPGFMGYRTLEAILKAGKNAVDIAFFIEDPFRLDALAKEKNLTAIMDIGVAPGMCNVLIGYADHLLDKTTNVVYYVGGLPEIREWPWEYKAGFSPIDVIEEYTRPARYMEKGELIIKPALSDPELLNFPGIGTLEAFNTDGLRSLATTIQCLNMKEKTLRYPGHIEKMRILREMGLFSYDEVMVKGQSVRPIDLTTKLLFPKWKLDEGEVDITVMKIVTEGVKEGRNMRYTWDLYDRYDPVTGIHSMARTTGYAATVALRMIADGLYNRKGVSVPEYVGKDPVCVDYLLKGLKQRGVNYQAKTETF